MFKDIGDDFRNTRRSKQGRLCVDRFDLFILRATLAFNCVYKVYPEGQHISVVDCVNDGIGMKFVPEGLCSCSQVGVSAAVCIDRKNGRTGKSKDMVLLEVLDDLCMHFAKLAAMTLIEYQHNMAVIDRMLRILRDEVFKLLYGCHDDFIIVGISLAVFVFNLALQDAGASVAVGRTFFKAIILFHRLIVEILAVDDKQHLVDAW